MVDFRELLVDLKDTGILDVILPFILFYAITYAIIEKSGIFRHFKKGKDDKEEIPVYMEYISMIVAFVFGIFGVISYDLVETVQQVIAYSAVYLVFFLCILLILGLIFGDSYKDIFKDLKDNKTFLIIIGIIVTLMVSFSLLYVIGALDTFGDWWDDIDTESISTIIFLVIIGAVLFFISKGSSGNSSETDKQDKPETD